MIRYNFEWSSGFGPGRCFLIWAATREPVAAGAVTALSVGPPGKIVAYGTGCAASACPTARPYAMISWHNSLSARDAKSTDASSVEAGCTVPPSLASDRSRSEEHTSELQSRPH